MERFVVKKKLLQKELDPLSLGGGFPDIPTTLEGNKVSQDCLQLLKLLI